MIRAVSGDKPKQWDVALPQIEFAFNSMLNRSTMKPPFEVVYTNVLRHTVDLIRLPNVNSNAEEFAERIQRIHQEVKQNLEDANIRYKTAVDQQRRLKLLNEGDLVMVYLRKNHFPVGTYNKLKDKKIRPFRILQKIGVLLRKLIFHQMRTFSTLLMLLISMNTFLHMNFPCKYKTLLQVKGIDVKARKRLSTTVLHERVKVLDDHQTGNVFQGFKPLASAAELSKASRAKRLLRKKATIKEEKKAAALAAGIDWKSDDSDDECPQDLREPPLPVLLKNEEHHHLIIDLCKSLSALQRYWDALQIINLCLKLACNTLSPERKEDLRTLGAQVAYNISDPAHGWDCVRYIVSRHPYSFSAWNCYYKVMSRMDNRYSKHNKFLHNMRVKHKDSVPPIMISAHMFTMISQHQAAAREYLEAYRLMPDSPLINLCVGTSLINLALGLRLQNKHQCMAQGLAFLFNNFRLCDNSQEALYNIARAYHHIGLVSLATTYYEKVLAMPEKDYPIPKLPNENQDPMDYKRPGYCDLRREAAYNLHLIYKKSGAFDLARQVLKDYLTF
ncbi:general transcription factor 3C polypeptide 3-like [Olea europaea var. sylvestris]|uniref:general transcription factor 3C polypeptide 3-like n=1 Tax=Olea europaea var. sylvestris TaxID=158386 RepID=UPI000C1D4346|nr:general transcription factor 3C polypeptide 3-like [Olea europaea var. sylvestris]